MCLTGRFVQTDMGAAGAKAFGLVDGAPTTVKESVDGLVGMVSLLCPFFHGEDCC